MSKELATTSQALAAIDPVIINSIVVHGDLSKLSEPQQTAYYNYRCQQAGLDPSATPFALLRLNGKLLLYAKAEAAQQLTGIHKLTDTITSKGIEGGIYVVTCRVTSPDGRSSENLAAVSVENLKGEALANAFMKAVTKAKRRTVLAHLGLGMLDETEVETIPGAVTVTSVTPTTNPEAERFAEAIGNHQTAEELQQILDELPDDMKKEKLVQEASIAATKPYIQAAIKEVPNQPEPQVFAAQQVPFVANSKAFTKKVTESIQALEALPN